MNVHVKRSAYYIRVHLVALVETKRNFQNVGVYLFSTKMQKKSQ